MPSVSGVFGIGSQDAVIEALNKSQAVVEFAMDGTLLSANQNFLDVMGYTLAEVKGKHHGMFVSPEYRESKEYQDFWESLRAGRFQAAEYMRIGKGGKEVWIQASYNPILDKTGKPVKVVKFATDMTERAHARANHTGQLEAINRSQAVIEFELDGTIITANQNFLDVVGYRLDEIKGKHHSIFVEPEYAASQEYKDFWARLHRGDYDSGEYMRLGKGGKEVWIQASYNPILDANGEPFKVVKYATDVTESTLRNADYRGQLEAIGKSQAVIEFNLDGTIITANQNFLDVVGYTLDEIRGEHHSIFVEPGYKDSGEYKQFWESLRAGKFQAAEYKRVGKGGKEVWIQASYNPILDPKGRPFKVVKYATDTTAVVKLRIEQERVGAMVDESLAKIVEAVEEANQMAAAASSASAQTSATVQTVAASSEEFSASAAEISQSTTLSQEAVQRVGSETAAADEATKALSSAADAMNSVVEIIQGIAEQINLLALNATIESARAGEAGKGFAVVATEVKNLARQVASATDQISNEIAGMQNVSQDVVQRLETIHQSVGSVEESVTVVAGAIEEQSAATQEITSNMQSAASAVEDINSNLAKISSSIGTATTLATEGMELYRRLRDAAA